MKKNLLLLSCTLALSACSIFSPYGTSNIPDPAPLQKYTPQVTPKVLWQKNVGVGSEDEYLKLTPTISNGVIYTIDQNGRFYATSAEGKKLWEKDFNAGGKSNLASDGTAVAFVDAKAVLHLLNVDKGKELWTVTLSDQALAAPTILPNMILVKTIDGNVTAFDRATGAQRWQYQHPVPDLMLRASSAVLVNGQNAYVGFADGKVVELNIQTGDEVWSTQAAEPQGFADIERMVDIDANLILQGNRLYVATYQGQVAALDRGTGNIIWQQPNSVYADIAADDHALYAVHADGTMTAYNLQSGKVLWQNKNLAWRFLTGPTLFQHDLVVGDLEGYLHFINPANGELLGRVQIDSTPTAMLNAPEVLGQSLIAINTQGRLVAVGL